ncbi:queuosine precursor transporter [Mucisphaera sp.]|uniref:queuosine precursor transporter n=1 Tax=Mucisphaera sp. TaxID=2913024 RepID=UPI003D11E61D
MTAAKTTCTITTLEPIDPRLRERRERTFLLLAGLFLGTLTMLNLLGITRFIVLASYTPEAGFAWGTLGTYTFAVAAGVLPYPLTFLCTDLISEFYGRARANAVVLVGLILNVWVLVILGLGTTLPGFTTVDPATGYPPPPEWNADTQSFSDPGGWTLFHLTALTYGAVLASMIAYMAAQFVDVYLFHFWKRLTKGRHLWLRNNASTMVSQFVDTFAVITITHFVARALPIDDAQSIWPQLWLFIATGYVFKFVIAALDTPIIYLVRHLLSRYLKLDPTVEHHGQVD